MKIVFTGLPYFSQKLVDELNNFDTNNTYYFFNTYYSFLDKLKFSLHLINTDLVISFNGVSSKSNALDLAIKLKKRILMQWHGSDVLLATEGYQNKTIINKYINYSSSFTDAPWLKDELSNININSEILPFKHIEVTSNHTQFKSKDALSYIAQDKEEFYGINNILLLAKKFPDTNFHIVGSNGKNFPNISSNIKFYGWINNNEFKKLRQQHPIFIRLTKHDGYSLSVMEALADGNEVLWNNPHSKCHFLKNENDLIKSFSHIQSIIEQKKYHPNLSNIEWVKTHMTKEKILNNFIKKIESFEKK